MLMKKKTTDDQTDDELEHYQTEIAKFGFSMLHALSANDFYKMNDPQRAIEGVVRYVQTGKLSDGELRFWQAMYHWSKPGYRHLGIERPPVPQEFIDRGFDEA